MECLTTCICCPTQDLNRGKSPILWNQNCMDQTSVKTALPPAPSDTEKEGRKGALHYGNLRGTRQTFIVEANLTKFVEVFGLFV